jgi:hypothetical protein
MKKSYLRETGIEHLKILPDPNDTILYLEGAKWYNWVCIIQLTDDERDQLIEVLQGLKAKKEARRAQLKKAAMEPDIVEPRFDAAAALKKAQEKAGECLAENMVPGNNPAQLKKAEQQT